MTTGKKSPIKLGRQNNCSITEYYNSLSSTSHNQGSIKKYFPSTYKPQKVEEDWEPSGYRAELKRQDIEYDRAIKRRLKRRDLQSLWPPYKETKEQYDKRTKDDWHIIKKYKWTDRKGKPFRYPTFKEYKLTKKEKLHLQLLKTNSCVSCIRQR